MELAVMSATKRNSKLVANLATKRPFLREAHVMRI